MKPFTIAATAFATLVTACSTGDDDPSAPAHRELCDGTPAIRMAFIRWARDHMRPASTLLWLALASAGCFTSVEDPRSTDGGVRELDAPFGDVATTPDVPVIARDAPAIPPPPVSCPGVWPEVSFATMRLDCGPDGTETTRIYVTPTPHACGDALAGQHLDLLGFGRPTPGMFRVWYEDGDLDEGDALFCDGDLCTPIPASRWQLEEYHPESVSPAGFSIACPAVDGTYLTAVSYFEVPLCGPAKRACR